MSGLQETHKKWLDDDDVIEEVEYHPMADNNTALLGIDCVEMQVHHEAGEWVEEDVNYDSQFMLDNIRKIGKAIREKFHWVTRPQKCYLLMDNAGGHRTEQAIKKYTDILQTEFDIEIIHQIPCSLETNVLDLGIWCSLQWAMDKLIRGKCGDMEALVQGVASVWDTAGGELSTAFTNVFMRLGRVFHLIEEDKGGNEFVEKKHGKRFAALDELPFATTLPPVDVADMSATAASTSNPVKDAEEIVDLLDDDDNDDELFL